MPEDDESDLVPIESLLYRGRAALDRAARTSRRDEAGRRDRRSATLSRSCSISSSSRARSSTTMKFGGKGALGIAISVACLYFAFRNVEWSTAVETARDANYWLLLLSAGDGDADVPAARAALANDSRSGRAAVCRSASCGAPPPSA